MAYVLYMVGIFSFSSLCPHSQFLFYFGFFDLALLLPSIFLLFSSSLSTGFFLTRPHTISNGHCITCGITASSLSTADMVDTQQLLAWPLGFSLNGVDLSELEDSSHSLNMKHLLALDYASLSSSPIQSSLSPSLVSSVPPASVAYDPSPPQSEEPLTNMDYTNLHSYTMDTQSKCNLTTLVAVNCPSGGEKLNS